MKLLFQLFLVLVLVANGNAQSRYFPDNRAVWEEKEPTEFKINKTRLDEAVAFAEANEYSGSRDLRIAILEGFEREPFHKILGPTKKRGGPPDSS